MVIAGTAACKSATSLSNAAASGALTVITSPLMIMLAFGTFLTIGKIVAS